MRRAPSPRLPRSSGGVPHRVRGARSQAKSAARRRRRRAGSSARPGPAGRRTRGTCAGPAPSGGTRTRCLSRRHLIVLRVPGSPRRARAHHSSSPPLRQASPRRLAHAARPRSRVLLPRRRSPCRARFVRPLRTPPRPRSVATSPGAAAPPRPPGSPTPAAQLPEPTRRAGEARSSRAGRREPPRPGAGTGAGRGSPEGPCSDECRGRRTAPPASRLRSGRRFRPGRPPQRPSPARPRRSRDARA